MTMKLVTRRDEAAMAVACWQIKAEVGPPSDRAIYEALLVLGSAPNPAAVDRITGTTSWTVLRCTHCATCVERAIELTIPEREDDGELRLCGACLAQALGLFGAAVGAVP